MPLTQTKYMAITVISGLIIIGLFATAIIVPLVVSINQSKNDTATAGTTVPTTAATTVPMTAATTVPTTVATTAATTTTVTTATTATTRTVTTATTTTVTTATTATTTTVTTVTTATTSTTTSALPVQWNATGSTVAGSSSGSWGVTANLLDYVYSCALDASNALYITDHVNNRIQKWAAGASSGSTVAGQSNGTAGASTTALQTPVGIALDSSNNMYFTDRLNSRVMYWPNGSSSGSVIFGVTGVSGSSTSLLYYPSALIRNSTTGTIYVADTDNHRIISFATGATVGTVLAGGNGAGNGPTQLNAPYCFAIDTVTNSLVIVNYGAHTVVRWVLGATSWTLLAGAAGSYGSTSTLLSYPEGVVLDPYGNIYVSDTNNHRIQFFPYGQSTGITIAGITGSAGATATQLNYPNSVILDSQLNLYVADTSNNRIQKFSRY